MLKNLSKKKIIILTSAVIILTFIIISVLRPNEEKFNEEIAKTQDITTYYSFEGNIRAKDSQNVVSKSNLSVKTLHVKEGDMVSVGDLLFELDDSSIVSSLEQAAASVELAKINYDMAVGSSKKQQLSQAQLNLNTSKLNYEAASGSSKDQQIIQTTNALETAQSTFDSAKLNFERVQSLYQIGGAAMVEVEQAQSALDSAQMQLNVAQSNFDNLEGTVNQSVGLANEQLLAAEKNYDALQESLGHNIRIASEQLKQSEASYASLKKQAEDTRVLAEVNGEVSDIFVAENESINMGKPIMDIVNYDDLEVLLKVDEYDLGTVTLGKEAEIMVSSLNQKVVGKITDISKQALVVNGVSYFETTISLEDNENLRVGLSTEAKILSKSAKNATTISMKALQFDNENLPYIYHRDIKGDVLTKSVTVGINDGIIVEILEGIEPGDTILFPQESLWNPMMGPPGMVD